MCRTIQLFLVAALVGAGTVAGFEVGGRFGFHEGYTTAMHSSDVVNALIALGSLKAEEKGDLEGARNVLETTIDSAMVTDWATSRLPARRPMFAPAEAYPDLTKSMKAIAEYRQSHPHDPGPYGKEMVEWALTRYGTPPQAQ